MPKRKTKQDALWKIREEIGLPLTKAQLQKKQREEEEKASDEARMVEMEALREVEAHHYMNYKHDLMFDILVSSGMDVHQARALADHLKSMK